MNSQQDIVTYSPETELRSLLKVVRNSVGTRMFSNFYVLKNGELYDALQDGSHSCSFYLSSVLAIFRKIKTFHNTAQSTIKDIEDFGWVLIKDTSDDGLKPGDILVWGAEGEEKGLRLGFCVGDGEAISASDEHQGVPTLHGSQADYRGANILRAYRLPAWDSVQV